VKVKFQICVSARVTAKDRARVRAWAVVRVSFIGRCRVLVGVVVDLRLGFRLGGNVGVGLGLELRIGFTSYTVGGNVN
jgi:hypothetical protein